MPLTLSRQIGVQLRLGRREPPLPLGPAPQHRRRLVPTIPTMLAVLGRISGHSANDGGINKN